MVKEGFGEEQNCRIILKHHLQNGKMFEGRQKGLKFTTRNEKIMRGENVISKL